MALGFKSHLHEIYSTAVSSKNGLFTSLPDEIDKQHSPPEEGCLNEPVPFGFTGEIVTAMRTIRREGLHALLMFLATIPFYLYGGNVLYGHRLLEDITEVALFIIRAGITVVVVEVLLNWLPHYGLQLTRWRDRYSPVLLSGALFGLLSYFVLPLQYHEGEAVIGMAAVWMVVGVILHKLFKRKQLYD